MNVLDVGALMSVFAHSLPHYRPVVLVLVLGLLGKTILTTQPGAIVALV
jgi:hypothetical protein